MAKKEKNVQTKELTIADPETGIDIAFSSAAQYQFKELKDQIKNGFATVSLALHAIREQRYYLMDECESMNEWLIQNFGSSIRTAQRLLEVGEAFSTIPNGTEILSMPISHLLTIKNDKDTMSALQSGEIEIGKGHVILPSGETMDLPSWYRRIKKETEGAIIGSIKSKEDKLKEQLSNSKEATRAMTEAVKSAEEELERERNKNKQLEKSLQDLMQKKDLDGMRIAFITQRDEAAEMLDDSLTRILDMLGYIDNIPQDLCDAKLSGHFGRTLAAIESAMERIRDRWSPIIYTPSTVGGTRESVIPE